jgi:hypothetical protein
VEAQEYLLRHFLGQAPVVKESPGKAVDHGLVLPHQLAEV